MGFAWSTPFFRGFIDCIAIIDYKSRLLQRWSATRASITIRNLDDDIKQRLRVRADLELPAREPIREPPQHQRLRGLRY